MKSPLKDIVIRLEAKIDKQSEYLASIDKTLGRQAVQLEHHIKRSDTQEENLEQHRSEVGQHFEAYRHEVEQHLEQIRSEVKPISTHVAVVGAVAKIVAFMGVLVGIAASVAKLAGWIS